VISTIVLYVVSFVLVTYFGRASVTLVAANKGDDSSAKLAAFVNFFASLGILVHLVSIGILASFK
jgi:hypothetical protein